MRRTRTATRVQPRLPRGRPSGRRSEFCSHIPRWNPETTVARADRELRQRTSADLCNRLTALLDQQFWCWGQDVCRAPANRRVEYGFCRLPPPEGVKASSCYQLRRPEYSVALWGFALVFVVPRRGSLFLRRFKMGPCLSSADNLPEEVWALEQIPPHQVPSDEDEWQATLELFERASAWIANFEDWILTRHGAAYRNDVAYAWKQSIVNGETMGKIWRAMRFGSVTELSNASFASPEEP
ncbi:MAG: hypothetical protein KF777_24925 [Planctomycetaceae bacterium]|nr:hypothetical protein [Planctomycetaceae bacterium]